MSCACLGILPILGVSKETAIGCTCNLHFAIVSTDSLQFVLVGSATTDYFLTAKFLLYAAVNEAAEGDEEPLGLVGTPWDPANRRVLLEQNPNLLNPADDNGPMRNLVGEKGRKLGHATAEVWVDEYVAVITPATTTTRR